MSRSHNAIVLGSAFYTAFVGMFDSENEKVGFAESIRTLPGSSLRCIGKSCEGSSDPTPIAPEDEPLPTKENHNTRMFLVILGFVLLTIMCVIAVVWYRRRATKDEDEERVTRRAKKGKKGYTISDEKDDDSDEDDDLSIDYRKPMLN